MEQSLQVYPGAVHIDHFRPTYFPRPGCVIEDITFTRIGSPAGAPPFFTARRLTIQAGYLDLFVRPGYIAQVIVEGLRVHIPPVGTFVDQSEQSDPIRTRVGRIVANGAVLEIARKVKQPLRFEFQTLTVDSFRLEGPLTYRASFHNPLPPGDLVSTGQFGPWNFSAPQKTPLSGSYAFERANLSVFDGIAGLLSSKGDFRGTLGHITSQGTIEVPNFSVTRSRHSVHVHSRYEVVVNGMEGDVSLKRIEASFLRTVVTVNGNIAGKPGAHGKFTSLDLGVQEGRIQDVLRLFVKEPQPPLNGTTNIRAHATLPPQIHPFLRQLRMTGDFDVASGHFSKPDTQGKIDQLSERASTDKKNDEDPPTVESSLSGHASLQNGEATLTDLTFAVPDARAEMHGSYNLIDEKVDLHGTLKTDSQFTKVSGGGAKSVFLKPFDAIFKRHPQGAVIPVQLTGTYSDPHPGLEITSKK
jgi:AsmA-like C-terminal region